MTDTYIATTCNKCGRQVFIVNDSYFVDDAKQETPISHCQICGSKLHMPKNILDGHDFQAQDDEE